ncbi:HAD-like domain-containing protein [Artemisia annua]|uniref:HAD-like domain-containing protein n=1 Tax=Artemisia annua TaxID=35608 RepID=A0A2U1LTS9_ARTAN|nr:HAD-like domain-containing protein [Artemisia annua]
MAIKGYAKPLIDRIDVENRFSHRLYRPSTSSTDFKEHVKELSCISTNFFRIEIVDNNPLASYYNRSMESHAYLFQMDNHMMTS